MSEDGGAPAVLWMDRELEGDLVVGTADELVGAIVESYVVGAPAGERAAALRQFCEAYAEDLQESLLSTALREESFSWAGCADRDITTINRRPDNPPPSRAEYHASVPLVVVRPYQEEWARPGPGPVVVLDPTGPERFLLSMRFHAGYLRGLGSLTAPSPVKHPKGW